MYEWKSVQVAREKYILFSIMSVDKSYAFSINCCTPNETVQTTPGHREENLEGPIEVQLSADSRDDSYPRIIPRAPEIGRVGILFRPPRSSLSWRQALRQRLDKLPDCVRISLWQ